MENTHKLTDEAQHPHSVGVYAIFASALARDDTHPVQGHDHVVCPTDLALGLDFGKVAQVVEHIVVRCVDFFSCSICL